MIDFEPSGTGSEQRSLSRTPSEASDRLLYNRFGMLVADARRHEPPHVPIAPNPHVHASTFGRVRRC